MPMEHTHKIRNSQTGFFIIIIIITFVFSLAHVFPLMAQVPKNVEYWEDEPLVLSAVDRLLYFTKIFIFSMEEMDADDGYVGELKTLSEHIRDAAEVFQSTFRRETRDLETLKGQYAVFLSASQSFSDAFQKAYRLEYDRDVLVQDQFLHQFYEISFYLNLLAEKNNSFNEWVSMLEVKKRGGGIEKYVLKGFFDEDSVKFVGESRQEIYADCQAQVGSKAVRLLSLSESQQRLMFDDGMYGLSLGGISALHLCAALALSAKIKQEADVKPRYFMSLEFETIPGLKIEIEEYSLSLMHENFSLIWELLQDKPENLFKVNDTQVELSISEVDFLRTILKFNIIDRAKSVYVFGRVEQYPLYVCAVSDGFLRDALGMFFDEVVHEQFDQIVVNKEELPQFSDWWSRDDLISKFFGARYTSRNIEAYIIRQARQSQ